MSLQNIYKKYFLHRNKFEKKLIFGILVLLVSVLLLFVALILSLQETSPCTSLECIKASNNILKFLNRSANPCDDFHAFVCGLYAKKVIHEPKSLIAELNANFKNEIDETIIENSSLKIRNSVKLQRQFYQSCINVTAIEEDQNQSFLILIDSLGGWPVIKRNQWNEPEFDWKDVMIKSKKIGLTYERLLNIGIYRNRTYMLKISHPSQVKSVKSENVEAYIEMMTDVSILLGAPSIGASGELRRTVLFETELAKIVEKSQNRSKNQSSVITIDNLQNRFPKFSWLQFLNHFFDNKVIFEKDTELRFEAEEYLKDLEILLLKTSKRVQANYIIWKIVETNIKYLTENIRSRYSKYERQFLEDVQNTKSREENCIQIAKNILPNVAESEYARKLLAPIKRKRVSVLFDNIKKQLYNSVNYSPNLKVDRVYEKYLKVIENASIIIGGHNDFFDDVKLEKYLGFKKVKFANNNIIHIVTTIGISWINNYYELINQQVSDEFYDFLMNPSFKLSAYFNPITTSIFLPSSLFQDVIYNENNPNYVNYGSLGRIIGHELSHALGVIGNQNGTSNFNKVLYNVLDGGSDCFLEDLTNYQKSNFPQKQYSPKTFEEIVADYIGTDIAYKAYQRFVKNNGHESKLPGVSYSPNQAFWIMSSIVFCEKIPIQESKTNSTAHHPDSRFRINNPLKNSPFFAIDFQCPIGSIMNPPNKCKAL